MFPLGVTTPGNGVLAAAAGTNAAGTRTSMRGIVTRVLRIGVAREIKTDEYRVALTPAGARELVLKGHDVVVETTAGDGSSFFDRDYERAGARIVSVDDVWSQSELLLKVKEPIEEE